MPRLPLRQVALLPVLLLLVAGCGAGGDAGSPVELKVFAAASLTDAFEGLGGDFTAAHPDVKVTYNFAGSQALATQIRQGAPADVFASADTANMAKVRDLVGAPKAFASNVLEIAVAPGNPKGVRDLADLARSDLKVVLAAPAVPAGRYARRLLDASRVTVEPVSLEDNVRAAVNKVALGEADAGIVYATDVSAAKGKVDGVRIPAARNVPATYPIATVTASAHQPQAHAFMDFVLGAQGRRVLATFGFLPPPTS
jgi:molybdate transport system substrate-binding protein